MSKCTAPVWILCSIVAAIAHSTEQSVPTSSRPMPEKASCARLAEDMQRHWPDSSTRIVDTHWVAAGTPWKMQGFPVTVTLPAHCEVTALMQERVGIDNQRYAIGFHLRLPQAWNGRFLFEGGGGSNGELGDAIGLASSEGPSALEQGYAVVSQNSGHDNAVNTVPERNGRLAFGFDPQARTNYGGASLAPVAAAAKAAINRYYGRNIEYSYFAGCSKGGQEGMMFAQRYPQVFDGIVAAAPGFSLPRAAVAEVWDLQAFNRIDAQANDQTIDLERLRESFSDAELALAREAVLDVCDEADGVRDGITANFAACTTPRVMKQLHKRSCDTIRSGTCLKGAQIGVLAKVYAGPKDSKGTVLYSDWPWDGGIGSTDWRNWKIGSPDGRVPSLNFILGAQALAGIFTTPPTQVADNPSAISAFVEGFSFDRDAQKIYATSSTYRYSAWEDVGARSADLAAFKAHGGKLIVPHGVSDPVFSVNDTLAWYREVDALNRGAANQFVRVFPVPGMAHCAGGIGVGQFDALAALVAWVEDKQAPEYLLAKGGATSPWPERTRPICAYPSFARYRGEGSIESAANFVCQEPASH